MNTETEIALAGAYVALGSAAVSVVALLLNYATTAKQQKLAEEMRDIAKGSLELELKRDHLAQLRKESADTADTINGLYTFIDHLDECVKIVHTSAIGHITYNVKNYLESIDLTDLHFEVGDPLRRIKADLLTHCIRHDDLKRICHTNKHSISEKIKSLVAEDRSRQAEISELETELQGMLPKKVD